MSSGGGPAIKAGMLKSVVSDLRSLDGAACTRVLAAIGDPILHAVQQAQRTEWLPASHMLAIDRALFDVLGPKSFADFWRAFGTRSADIPLIRPFISAALRAFTTPERLYKLIPSALEATGREMGQMTGVTMPDGLGFEMTHSDLPPLKDIELYVEACRSSYHAPLDLMKVEGSVVLDERRSTRTTAVMVARWTAPGT